MTLRYLSLFSGIEAATAAWSPLGWECVGVAEIEKFPCEVLAARHPGVPNLGNVSQITEEQIAAMGRIDLIVFGSPCQDLSVAGKRQGFQDGTRSSLFFTAMRIIGWAREWCGLRFALWENVPGAFSSNEGRDFAAVVEQMAGAEHVVVPTHGWGSEGCALGDTALVEWGTLDAQWFGVAQRRRRVFALADFGDWAHRPPILLEPEGMRGDSAPRREAGQEAAAGTLRGSDGGCDLDHACAGHLIAFGGNNTSGPIAAAAALTAKGGSGRMDFDSETFIAFMPARTLAADGGVDERFAPREVCDALHTSSGSGNKAPLVMAFHGAQDPDVSGPITHPMAAQTNGLSTVALIGPRVRRLTPRECERLQGFADEHTNITVRGEPAKDGPRYKALGNSMAVPVMNWIGRQIDMTVALFQGVA